MYKAATHIYIYIYFSWDGFAELNAMEIVNQIFDQ